MKTIRTLATIAAMLCCLTAKNQCPNDNTLTFASPQNMTPPGVGQTVTNVQVWGGEYAIVNVTSGVMYRFVSCSSPTNINSYLTLRQSSNGNALAWANNNTCSNHEQFDWLATFTGESRILMDEWNGSSCINNGTNMTLSVTQLTTLPIELSSFTASTTPDNTIRLDWSTASEQNNKHFVIMRSTDGKNFVELKTIAGMGDSNFNTLYSYEDKNIEANQVYYYYLAQVDLDGQTTNSHVVVAQVKDYARLFLGELYPNPVGNFSILRYNAPEKAVNFIIYDIVGNSHYNQTFPTTKPGLNEFGIDPEMMGLKPGIYYLKVSSGKDIFVKQFMVAN
jgi:hypothetical protein